jgi:hypothetical protein
MSAGGSHGSGSDASLKSKLREEMIKYGVVSG